jgi:adenine/guanine phosphoribosyltransferase-like PRPP-binding protein
MNQEQLKGIDIVAVFSAGGAVVGSLVACELGIPMTTMVLNDNGRMFLEESLVSDKNVLIVDDVSRTGQTIYASTIAARVAASPNRVLTMCLFNVMSDKKKKYSPEIAHRTIEDVKLPWDKKD